MTIFGINSFDEVWEGFSRDGTDGDWVEMEDMMGVFAGWFGAELYDIIGLSIT